MRIFLAAIFSMVTVSAFAEDESWKAPFDYAVAFPEMVAPFEPFRVIGNLYYVGTEGLAVYLITDKPSHFREGEERAHILIDGGLPGYEHIIIDNIAKLGFNIKDVKILLNTHAHFDHSGGLAVLKEASGAELIAAEGDVSALEGGFYLGHEDNENFSAPQVAVDTTISVSGDYLIFPIGGAFLTAQHTPGHSRGCTSWQVRVKEGAKHYDALIFCSATVAANSLVNPPQYEGIVDDYRTTFEKTKDWDPDIFLANHPEVFHMKETREKQKAGDTLAFVNRGAFQKYIAEKERAFERALAEQKAESKND